ncbi:hypothetical protein CROQUDRAFT_90736 [Cronartium quercuum f. sp. fusiforme G11]|uniref:Uncharacterized protein n=1 Tax=Cronartium quercuum f. sp. fusiforme G11 TaxID=708437 RepID=A0A9P6TDQ1_9BASI|nr:hypothetical protein CROQUDRAFT_90736 [Cronartium quercuum f. sp. fusiforme G11]
MNVQIEIQPNLESENNVLGLKALPPHHQSCIPIPDQIRPPSPMPVLFMLMFSSQNTIGPKQD